MYLQLRRPLVTALAMVLGVALVAPMTHADPQSAGSRRDRSQSKNKKEEAAKPPLYPDASRKSPETKASQKLIKQLQAMQEKYEKDDWAGVTVAADEIGANAAANAYDKSIAYSMAGNAASNLDDQNKAADYFAKAVAADGLDNDGHYSTMLNLAIILYQEEKYEESMKVLDRFLAETKSDKPDHIAIRGALLSSLNRNVEAAEVYKSLFEKNPSDKRMLMNAVSALQSADKFPEANVLMEDAYKRGMLTEQRELRSLYVGYMNAERWADAQKVIEDGEAKGILKPGPDLGRDLQVLAQNAYFEDKLAQAIALYQRAAPMMDDGEGYLNLAKVLDMDGKKAQAKEAAKKALEKGVKKPADAKLILSR